MNKQKPKIETSAMAVVLCRGTILCTVEEIYGKPVLSLPKGHVESGETILQTAIRECYEETDVTLCPEMAVKTLKPYTYTFTTPNGQQTCKTLYPVLFNLTEQQTPRAKEHKIREVKYMDIDEFVRECSYDNVRALVKDVIS